MCRRVSASTGASAGSSLGSPTNDRANAMHCCSLPESAGQERVRLPDRPAPARAGRVRGHRSCPARAGRCRVRAFRAAPGRPRRRRRPVAAGRCRWPCGPGPQGRSSANSPEPAAASSAMDSTFSISTSMPCSTPLKVKRPSRLSGDCADATFRMVRSDF